MSQACFIHWFGRALACHSNWEVPTLIYGRSPILLRLSPTQTCPQCSALWPCPFWVYPLISWLQPLDVWPLAKEELWLLCFVFQKGKAVQAEIGKKKKKKKMLDHGLDKQKWLWGQLYHQKEEWGPLISWWDWFWQSRGTSSSVVYTKCNILAGTNYGARLITCWLK